MSDVTVLIAEVHSLLLYYVQPICRSVYGCFESETATTERFLIRAATQNWMMVRK